jgi:SET domain-containing protein
MKIESKKSEIHGHGVFATEKIFSGDIIEKCPVVPIKIGELPFLKKSTIVDYLFEWETTPFSEYKMAFILGYCMVYNHSYSPNSKTLRNFEDGTMDFVALKDIESGEEITHNYNGNHGSTGPMWFEVKS